MGTGLLYLGNLLKSPVRLQAGRLNGQVLVRDRDLI